MLGTRLLCIFTIASLALAGCGRWRFVIDAVPAADDLTETVVMEDSKDGLSRFGKSKIALIEVTGMISDYEKPGLLGAGENPLGRFAESLRRAASDSAVKAVIIRINSPGGTVTASDVMYREILHFKDKNNKPVVISMADVAASGGYYVACAGDEIIAHPTTVTGSIGVLLQTINVVEGLKKLGVKAEAITSGSNKAMGSPLEPVQDEHRRLLQNLVDEFYANFDNVVVQSRPNVSPGDMEWIRDGRVVTGKRAAEVGLIDRVGDLRDAFEAAKKRANLLSARLVKYHRPLEHVGSAYSQSPVTSTQFNVMQFNLAHGPWLNHPNFYYMWDPSIQ